MTAVAVEFSTSTQSLGALKEAAYRLLGHATCQIDEVDGRYVCRLTPAKANSDDVATRFIDLVTDENLREKLAAETGPLRNVIVALAFGALAAADE